MPCSVHHLSRLGLNIKLCLFVFCPVQWKSLLQRWKCEVQRYRLVLGFCLQERCVPGVSGKCLFLIAAARTSQYCSFPLLVLGMRAQSRTVVKGQFQGQPRCRSIYDISGFCMDISINSDISVTYPLLNLALESMIKNIDSPDCREPSQ